jgi:hypothetical protein
VIAGIAIRRIRTKASRTALARAECAAREAGIPALIVEVENATLALNRPAARLVASGEERLLLLEDVEALLVSKALIVDACRHVVRESRTIVPLASRPVIVRPCTSASRSLAGRCAEGRACRRCFRGEVRR